MQNIGGTGEILIQIQEFTLDIIAGALSGILLTAANWVEKRAIESLKSKKQRNIRMY